jgi:hypothetical protein
MRMTRTGRPDPNLRAEQLLAGGPP